MSSANLVQRSGFGSAFCLSMKASMLLIRSFTEVWARPRPFVDRFFPPIKLLHPLPCHRVDARTRGKSPVR